MSAYDPNPPPPRRRRRTTPLVLLAIGVASALGGCGQTPAARTDASQTASPSSPAEPQPATAKAPAPTVTVTITATPPEGATTPPTAGLADPGSGDEKPIAVPDLVGMDLQLAQDTAQAKGFYLLTSHDLLGAHRMQVLDRNWKVCTQAPAAGKEVIPTTELTFGTVKLDERCP